MRASCDNMCHGDQVWSPDQDNYPRGSRAHVLLTNKRGAWSKTWKCFLTKQKLTPVKHFFSLKHHNAWILHGIYGFAVSLRLYINSMDGMHLSLFTSCFGFFYCIKAWVHVSWPKLKRMDSLDRASFWFEAIYLCFVSPFNMMFLHPEYSEFLHKIFPHVSMISMVDSSWLLTQTQSGAILNTSENREINIT